MALGNSLKYKTYHMYNIQKQYFVNFLLYNYERYYHPSKKKKMCEVPCYGTHSE